MHWCNNMCCIETGCTDFASYRNSFCVATLLLVWRIPQREVAVGTTAICTPRSAARVARSPSLFGTDGAASLARHRPLSRLDTCTLPRQQSDPSAAALLPEGCSA